MSDTTTTEVPTESFVLDPLEHREVIGNVEDIERSVLWLLHSIDVGDEGGIDALKRAAEAIICLRNSVGA